jgi:hypothetical protein
MTVIRTPYRQTPAQETRGTQTYRLAITGEPAADLELAEQMLSDKAGAVR